MNALLFQRINTVLLRVIFVLCLGLFIAAAGCLAATSFLPAMMGIDPQALADDSEMGEAVKALFTFTLTATWWGLTVLAVTAFWVKDEEAPSMKNLSGTCLYLVVLLCIGCAGTMFAYLRTGGALEALVRQPFETVQALTERGE